MPALDEQTTETLKSLLEAYLAQRGTYSTPKHIASGGSAAVFKSVGPHGARAFKVFDPRFLQDESCAAEVRRLNLQKELIDHDCENLIDTYSVDQFQSTAIVEMELIDWPQLKEKIADFPQEYVQLTISQLVLAVKYLESRGIVHRDIKPENIHISHDYQRIKLLDLGVAREFDSDPNGAITDHNGTRPFIATAQYSSPEYLFRLDAPSRELWNALNIYQVGAVLHDLIMQKEIFSEEIKMGNRWLIARAVLFKTPSLDNGNTRSLTKLKALACRCLSKDMNTRLATVGWEDFDVEPEREPLSRLRQKVAKSNELLKSTNFSDALAKLDWERAQHWAKICEHVRGTIQSICKSDFPSRVTIPSTSRSPATLDFDIKTNTSQDAKLAICVQINWCDTPQEHIANLFLQAMLSDLNQEQGVADAPKHLVCSTALGCNIAADSTNLSNAIAATLEEAIDICQTIETFSAAIFLPQMHDKEAK